MAVSCSSDGSARDEQSVTALYKDSEVAETYIQKRFSHAWSRLLHQKQVMEINRVLRTIQPKRVLEVAPGPARIATELQGIYRGVMLESSEAMLARAKHRLALAGLDEVWELQCGNAFELEKFHCQFDLLYTFRFLRHFRCSERVRLYYGIATCLHPQGWFMFDVVNQTIRQKLDSKRSVRMKGELDIYDATYTPETLRQEMGAYGFEVVRLVPVVAHFSLQSWVSYRLDHRLASVSEAVVRGLEKLPSSQPLEWIVICRKNT
jgi:hypothetical protein